MEAVEALFVGLSVTFGLSFDVFGVFLLVILLLLHPFRSLRKFIYKKKRGVWGEGCPIGRGKGLVDLVFVAIWRPFCRCFRNDRLSCFFR